MVLAPLPALLPLAHMQTTLPGPVLPAALTVRPAWAHLPIALHAPVPTSTTAQQVSVLRTVPVALLSTTQPPACATPLPVSNARSPSILVRLATPGLSCSETPVLVPAEMVTTSTAPHASPVSPTASHAPAPGAPLATRPLPPCCTTTSVTRPAPLGRQLQELPALPVALGVPLALHPQSVSAVSASTILWFNRSSAHPASAPVPEHTP